MRPDILNPLFTEVELLKGVGPGLSKPLARLGLARAVDVLFHLPTGVIERQAIEKLDDAAIGTHVSVIVTPVSYQQSGNSRAPFRVQATDSNGDYISLTYFGPSGGYAKKLFPLGIPKRISGKLEQYGQERQIIHPDHVLAPDAPLPAREAVYPLADGLTGKRMAQFVAQALERAPALSEWIEPSLLVERGWAGWREGLMAIHADPRDELARTRLAYDEVFANQLALMLVRASTRRRKGTPLTGDGHVQGLHGERKWRDQFKN